jgi:hypothetical protein
LVWFCNWYCKYVIFWLTAANVDIFYIRCEPFSSYPRTYDLLHANYLFSHYKNKEGCVLEDIMLEMDRLIRPLVITFSIRLPSWLSACEISIEVLVNKMNFLFFETANILISSNLCTSNT